MFSRSCFHVYVFVVLESNLEVNPRTFIFDVVACGSNLSLLEVGGAVHLVCET
jgi:hypothetical protein